MRKIYLLILISLSFLNASNFVAAAGSETVKIDSAPEATLDSSANQHEQQLPKLIDFGSKQCVACKAMESVLDKCKKSHADKFKTEFVDVWVRENQALAKLHNIKTIPTQIFLTASGDELFRHTGLISEKDILAKWSELGYKFNEAAGSSAKPDLDRAD